MTNAASDAPRPPTISLPGVALMVGVLRERPPMLDVAAKLASSSIPVGQITAARFVVQCALMAPFVWIIWGTR